MKKDFIEAIASRVAHFIATRRLLLFGQPCLVALSGGADSVSLLLLLKRLGYQVEAVHCNFNLRGQESMRDEMFCVDLCHSMHIPLHRVHFDTRTYAQLHHVSIEMAARQLRYHHFSLLLKDLNAQAVCVGHHRDDSVETFLLNLVRGTGWHGLTGISPKNGQVVRPLLCLTKEEILKWLDFQQQPYVTDSTNLTADVRRNKIRLQLMPILQQLNPNVSHNIALTAHRIAECSPWLDQLIAEKVDKTRVQGFPEAYDISSLSHESLLFAILHPLGFSSAQIEQVFASLSSPTGTVFKSSTHRLLFDRGRLIVEPIEDMDFKTYTIPECGIYDLNNNHKLTVRLQPMTAAQQPSRKPSIASLDASHVVFPLQVRTVKKGDRFCPFGMRGSRLLSDFLTDLKLNRFDKQRQLVVSDSCGNIIWVVGLRIDNRYRLTSQSIQVLTLIYE